MQTPMTDNPDDFWDLLYRGCGLPADAPPAAKDGSPPPDRQATQQRVFRFYAHALGKTDTASEG